jgi:HAE1 family hydrophobic/amphiphilic exporter-1
VIRLTKLAVSKRSVTVLVTLAMLLGGAFSWMSMKQELLPDIQFPYLVVVTSMPGASAQDVSTQVTEPIERSISSLPRLKHINSSSVNSISIVVSSFSYGTDVKETKAAIETNVSALNLGQTSQVIAFDINAMPSLMVAVRVPDGSAETQDQLNEFVVNQIVPSLEGLDGVASVDVTGYSQKRIQVSLDPAKLADAGVSISQIQGVLAANNLILPAGSMPTSDISIPVSAQHEFNSVEEIAGLVVGVKMPTADGTVTQPTPVALGQLGTVELVSVQPSGYAQVDGKSALILSVTKTSDGNTVSMVEAAMNRLDQLAAENPGTFHIDTIEDLSVFVIQSRDSLVEEGGLGALFAFLTILFFLISLRSTLVAAFSIPVSIFTALLLMFAAGISINMMTLGGLAVAVGRVVDDAIVVLENIYRHRGRGEPMREAVISGTKEVASAITSSTLTTVAVFLPIGFIGGIVSQFFLPFALTVTFALLASLVCALTVVPVLASLFIDRVKLNPDHGPEHRDTFVQRIYTPVLKAALHNRRTRWAVIGISALLVVFAGLLVPFIPTQFINVDSGKYLQVTVSPPSGTPSERVLEVAQQVDTKIKSYSEVELVETTVPGEGDTGLSALASAFTGRAPNTATILVRLNDSVDLDAEQKQFSEDMKAIAASLPTGTWQIEVAQQNLTSGTQLSVVVSGTKSEDVASATSNILTALRDVPDLINVKSDLATQTPEIQVAVDPNKALFAGLTTAQVQGEIRNALVGTKAGTINLDSGPADLYLKLNVEGLNSVEALRLLPVGTTRAPLSSVATVDLVQTQARITRVDQSPAATVTADTTSKNTGAISAKLQEVLDNLKNDGKLPGVTVTLSGVTEQMNEAFGGLYLSMAVAILLVYLVMVLVFDSLIDPLVIMFSLPLATIGAFPALFITQRAIGISALIGFLMLIGIVVTNAIVLLDLVEQHRHRGMPMYDALIEGGRTRVRPILMTAIATILALSPLGAGLSHGTLIASELATVVIGGLFTSTFLTLIVVPVVYSLVEDAKGRVRRTFGFAPEHVGDLVAEAAAAGDAGVAAASVATAPAAAPKAAPRKPAARPRPKG